MVSDRSDRFPCYFKIGSYHWLLHGVWGINSTPPCGLQLLSPTVIMHVLSSAAVVVLVPVHLFLAGKSCTLMKEKGNWLFLARGTMFYSPHSPPTPPQLLWFPFLLRATRRDRNPHLQVIITHTSHVYSQHSFGLPLRMNGMHRTQFWSRALWLSATKNLRKA